MKKYDPKKIQEFIRKPPGTLTDWEVGVLETQIRKNSRVIVLFIETIDLLANKVRCPNDAVPLTRLRKRLAVQMDEFIDQEDFRHYLSRNYSFHFMIYAAAKNSELVSIIESLWAQTGPFLAAGVRQTGMTPDWRQMHSRIAGAIRLRQPIDRDLHHGLF